MTKQTYPVNPSMRFLQKLGGGLMAIAALHTANAGTASIDLTSLKQTIRGYGAATVTWQSTITDTHFNVGFGTSGGVGLTIARLRVPATTTQSGWANEVSNGAKAKSRGAIAIASVWSPPPSMKDNNNGTDGKLLTSQYGAYVTHLNNFSSYASANGCSLYALSIQNEPDIDVDYESCHWTATELLNFAKNNAGSMSGRVMMSESFKFNWAYTDPILNDSTARANVDIIVGHIYGGGISYYTLAKNNGKEVWMTEHLNEDTTMTGVMQTAKSMHDCMNVAQFNAYVWWYVKRDYGPVSEAGARTKRGCVMAQYARFVRPGHVRVSCTANPSTGVYVTAYKGGGKAVVVAVNTSTSTVSQPFSFVNGTVSSVTPYRTSSSQNLATLSSVTLSGNAFTYSLPGQSVTTFVQN